MTNTAKYRPDIDGLRAIAVLAVVAFHAAPGRLPGGFIGVDVFFVISGFLISSILLNGLEQGRFSILEFYRRRIRRIFPALVTVLLACAVAGWFLLLPEEYRQLGKHIAAGAAFASNFALWSESGYFDISAMFKPLLHLWSLGIEEQFYIFWPLMLWAAFRKKWSMPWLIGMLAVFSFTLNLHLTGTDKSSAFYLPFPRFWELLIGAMLACTTQARQKIDNPPLNNAQSATGMVLLLAGFVLINEKGAFPGWWVLLPVFGSALMISAGPQALFNRWILSNRMMVWVGLISYPLYLWHWPILSFLRIMEGQEILQYKRVIAVAAAFLLAWLTYQYVEKPIRFGKSGKSTVFTLAALMALIGIFGFSIYLADGFKQRSGTLPEIVNVGDIGELEFFTYLKKNSYPCSPDSIYRAAGNWNGFIQCYQSKPSDRKYVAIMGDSHAEQLYPGLSEAMPDRNVVFYPTDGMPFLNDEMLAPAFDYVLHDSSIQTVLITAIWRRKIASAADSQWKSDLIATVDRLTKADKTVYITDDVPQFSFIPSRCKFAGRLGIENKCSEADTHEYLKYRPAFDEIARNNPRFHVIRTYDQFCTDGTCKMGDAGVLYFRDEHHLNMPGSRKVGLEIVRQMNAIENKGTR